MERGFAERRRISPLARCSFAFLLAVVIAHLPNAQRFRSGERLLAQAVSGKKNKDQRKKVALWETQTQEKYIHSKEVHRSLKRKYKNITESQLVGNATLKFKRLSKKDKKRYMLKFRMEEKQRLKRESEKLDRPSFIIFVFKEEGNFTRDHPNLDAAERMGLMIAHWRSLNTSAKLCYRGSQSAAERDVVHPQIRKARTPFFQFLAEESNMDKIKNELNLTILPRAVMMQSMGRTWNELPEERKEKYYKMWDIQRVEIKEKAKMRNALRRALRDNDDLCKGSSKEFLQDLLAENVLENEAEESDDFGEIQDEQMELEIAGEVFFLFDHRFYDRAVKKYGFATHHAVLLERMRRLWRREILSSPESAYWHDQARKLAESLWRCDPMRKQFIVKKMNFTRRKYLNWHLHREWGAQPNYVHKAFLRKALQVTRYENLLSNLLSMAHMESEREYNTKREKVTSSGQKEKVFDEENHGAEDENMEEKKYIDIWRAMTWKDRVRAGRSVERRAFWTWFTAHAKQEIRRMFPAWTEADLREEAEEMWEVLNTKDKLKIIRRRRRQAMKQLSRGASANNANNSSAAGSVKRGPQGNGNNNSSSSNSGSRGVTNVTKEIDVKN